MKRDELEKYIGKLVQITLFDGEIIEGVLYKTGSERYKNVPNFYIPQNSYVTENVYNSNKYSCVFKCSHVRKIKKVN